MARIIGTTRVCIGQIFEIYLRPFYTKSPPHITRTKQDTKIFPNIIPVKNSWPTRAEIINISNSKVGETDI